MTVAEFDYQWSQLPSANTMYTPERVREFLKLVKLPASFFKGKFCLDAGCGNGRNTVNGRSPGQRDRGKIWSGIFGS